MDIKHLKTAEKYLSKNIMRDHVLKQFFFGISVGKISQFEKYVNNPRTVQELRSQSLYTTYDSKTGRAKYPSKGVTIAKTLYQIRFVNGALMNLLGSAYVKQHNGQVDDESFALENNTVMNDSYMVDEACAKMHSYKIALPFIYLLSTKPWYPTFIKMFAIVISIIALFWLLQRVFFS